MCKCTYLASPVPAGDVMVTARFDILNTGIGLYNT